MPPMKAELLKQYLTFYQDLGIESVYRRSSEKPVSKTPEPETSRSSPEPPFEPQPEAALSLPGMLPTLAPEGDTMEKIRADIGDCTRCGLHEGRNKLVFGDGNEHTGLVFVGEGPGADEDAQGIPFVGRAGKLLTQMIENTAAKEGIPLLFPSQ